MNYRKAQEFLTRCFAPDETIALLLRRENPLKVMQRVVKLETAIAPRYIGWLASREHHWRECLCCRQSAAAWHPETDEGKHRFSPSLVS